MPNCSLEMINIEYLETLNMSMLKYFYVKEVIISFLTDLRLSKIKKFMMNIWEISCDTHYTKKCSRRAPGRGKSVWASEAI